jgi:multidrug efflux system membrane fusion protein
MRRGFSNHWKLSLAMLCAVVVGCTQKPGADASKKPVMPPALVTVAEATTMDVPSQLFAIGSVKASATVNVKSQQRGQLQKAGFKEGDEVKAGDLLFTIESKPFDAALAQSQANLARDRALLVRAEADLKRADELRKTDSIAQSAYDQFRSSVDSLKATIMADEAMVSMMQVQRDFCSIRAPISGRAGALLVDEGNIVRDVDTVLMVINQLKPVYVDFSLPEQNLPEVRAHMAGGKLKVTASPAQHDEIKSEGELSLVNNEVDTKTGTILLRGTFANENETLWPGQFVNVALTLDVKKDAVLVPVDAVQVGQMGNYVFIAKDDQTAELRPVTTGVESGKKVVIEKGVKAGERVITSGLLKLQNGSKFEVRGAAKNPPAEKTP